MSNYFKKTISKNKKYIIISHALCALMDFISVILLLISGVGFNYLVYPFVFLVNDIVFGINFALSNPRFKYTVKEHIVFESIALIFLILIPSMFFFTAKVRIMTLSAFILLLVSRLVVYGVTGRILVLTRNDVDYTDNKQIYLTLSIALFFALGYIAFSITSGFFGQGTLSSNLIYSKKKDGTYEVVDVLNSRDETIIPSSFNGQDVTSINLSIFTNGKLKEITILDGTVPILLSDFVAGYKGSLDFNEDIKVNLSSKNKDSLIESINKLYQDNNISMEDSILLKNLLTLSKEQGSHIVNVEIKAEDANKIQGFSVGQISIISGDIFTRETVGNSSFSYIEAKDCFEKNDKYYLDIVDDGGNSIFGKTITEDMNVKVSFVRVYKINFVDASTITKFITENEIEEYYNDFKNTYDGADMETQGGVIIKTLNAFIENLHNAVNSTLNIALSED